METEIDKVLKCLKESNIQEVERDTKISSARMYKWIAGKGNPKATDLMLLINYFRISSNVPYPGEQNEGSTKGASIVRMQTSPSVNSERKGVPYFDVDFMGGFDVMENDQTINPLFYIDFLPFNDADYWINVTGKSMGPLIAHGDIVALKKVEDWKEFLLEGEIYAISTSNGFRTIKIIGAGNTKDDYLLIPYNKSGDYKPQAIPKKVITHIYRVKGAMKKFF